jgi:hypothetical protein
MSNLNKPMTTLNEGNTLRAAYNDVDASITVNGFLVGAVGNKVLQTIATTNVANDSLIYDFTNSGTLLYTIKVVFTDGTRTTFLSAERTA